MEKALLTAIFAFALSFALIKIMKPVSRRIGLIDKPDARKRHEHAVPLVGGLAIYCTLLIVGLLLAWQVQGARAYLIAAGFITIVGVLDDWFDLDVSIRILCSFAATGVMMYWGGAIFTNLGNLLGFGDIVMPLYVAVPFTLIACFGVINSINMIDGLDGLSSGIAIMAYSSILVAMDFSAHLLLLIITLIGATLAFMMFNLQVSVRLQKVFMGDAGSMLIGFSLILILCHATQTTVAGSPRFAPVTGLYFIGLPLIDMVATVLRRIQKGKNPFKADRTHAHHILLDLGLSPKRALLVMLSVAATINAMGILLHYLETPAWLQFGLFLLLFILYFQGARRRSRQIELLDREANKQLLS